MKIVRLLIAAGIMLPSLNVLAHPGGVDQNGGHRDSRTSEYHCHSANCDTSIMNTRVIVPPKTHRATKHFEDNSYVRKQYMSSWPDIDKDCQDLRAELLIKTSINPVVFQDVQKCRVTGGKWLDPYTDSYFIRPSKVDIDHIIPLSYAHNQSGYQWSSEKKRAFAVDPINLWVVSATENRRKGDKGPSQYMPPNNVCKYQDAWKRVADKYDIKIKEVDVETINRIYRNQCSDRY